MVRLEKLGAINSWSDCGDKGRVGVDLDIGDEMMARVRPRPDQLSRGTIQGAALEELT